LIAGLRCLTALLILCLSVGLLLQLCASGPTSRWSWARSGMPTVSCALDGRRGYAGFEDSGAPTAAIAARHSIPPRLARRVSVATASSAWICRVADHDASLLTEVASR